MSFIDKTLEIKCTECDAKAEVRIASLDQLGTNKEDVIFIKNVDWICLGCGCKCSKEIKKDAGS